MCITLVTEFFLFVFIHTEVKLFLFQDCIGKVQSFFQSVRSPSKPRSPLSDSSSMLIQDGNECDSVNADSLKVKKGEHYSQFEFKLTYKCQNNTQLFLTFLLPAVSQPCSCCPVLLVVTRSMHTSKVPAHVNGGSVR